MHDSPVIRGFVTKQLETDPVAARAEFLSEWRTDIGPYVDPLKVDAATVQGRASLPYDLKQPRVYWAFCDPSGGSQDDMTLAVAHREGDKLVVDHLSVWPAPFDPDDVVEEAAIVLRSYRQAEVYGDHVGGVWVREPLRKAGVTYHVCREPKTKLYRDTLPRLNAGLIELLDHDQCNRQIKKLERKVSRAGDIIDHPPGGHDDACNSVLGAVWLADNYGLHREAPKAQEPPAETTHEIARRGRLKQLESEKSTGGRRVSSPAQLRDWMRRPR
jgi:hypothetical protein